MPDSRIREAIELMTGLAERTGLSEREGEKHPTRGGGLANGFQINFLCRMAYAYDYASS